MSISASNRPLVFGLYAPLFIHSHVAFFPHLVRRRNSISVHCGDSYHEVGNQVMLTVNVGTSDNNDAFGGSCSLVLYHEKANVYLTEKKMYILYYVHS